ncbi:MULTISPECIES: hypothetical protein [Lysobacter]|uniref:hypothetical protein n=1 Tax=Lysobacter TaxID=68 RepID=UPI001F2C26EF|nr:MULTISPECIES: hypothetical protein [Lysobacter]UJB17882.1 hypothetical protein L1A79_16135 [Lysobacter capsici]UJQ28395.1 hypothetical protein L2D09_23750 [Lysobacter gummosus]
MDPVTETSIQDYLRADIVAADLPDLQPLLGARELLRAFSTLFHGGEESVMVRLLVLRAIGERGQAPDWTPQELREHFAYLEPVKFDTVIGRLRDNDLLLWDNESQRYRISPAGRQALSAIGLLLQFNREGDELAYVTAQIAAGQAVGRVRPDDLQHLLSRLNELREDFDQAVLSGSEHRILRAAGTLQQAWRWIEKGTQIVEEISSDLELDSHTHRVAQQIGRAQSAMLRQASVFQRALSTLDRHRVHLGASGLSSSDVNRFLRDLDIDSLAAIADDVLARSAIPAFVLSPIALDVAEYELVEREREAREDQSLPPSMAAPSSEGSPAAATDFQFAEHWLDELTALAAADGEATSLSALVPRDGFSLSAYRMSLLGLIGDPGAENREGVSASMARLPLAWHVEPEFEIVERAGVAYMSRSRLQTVSEEERLQARAPRKRSKADIAEAEASDQLERVIEDGDDDSAAATGARKRAARANKTDKKTDKKTASARGTGQPARRAKAAKETAETP